MVCAHHCLRYDTTYYNSKLQSYGKTALEVQTMSSVSIGAGAVPAVRFFPHCQ